MIDVAINVYGKPYHTLVSLLSLLKHSGKWIDKIYVQFENKLPHGDEVEWIKKYLPDNTIYSTPKFYFGYRTSMDKLGNDDYRLSVRYQYAWENSDKDFLFTLHNDMLFKGDIIGEMLERIKDKAAIGSIGQCWNCPANNVCKSFETFKPTYEEAIKIVKENPASKDRTTVELIDKVNPMPLPECRVNEWACLINLKKLKNEVIPIGDTPPFGCTRLHFDTGVDWFRSLYLKKYEFVNWDGEKDGFFTHAPFTICGGNSLDGNKIIYKKAESVAREYFKGVFLNGNK